MNIQTDREAAVTELNRIAAIEGFDSTVEATNEFVIDSHGVIWHKVIDTSSRVTYFVTTSLPTNIPGLYREEKVYTLMDEDEIRMADLTF